MRKFLVPSIFSSSLLCLGILVPTAANSDTGYLFRWKVPGVVASDSQHSIPDSRCDLPWGGRIGDGQTVIAWKDPDVAHNETCDSQERVCAAGALSGSYSHQSCEIRERDTSPDEFQFADATFALGQYVTSEAITVSGIEGAVSASISGPESAGAELYFRRASGGTGKTKSATTLVNEDSFYIRMYMNMSYNQTYEIGVTLGDYSTTWNVSSPSLDMVAWGSHSLSRDIAGLRNPSFGTDHILAITPDGGVFVSGPDTNAMISGAPSGNDFVSVAMGGDVALAIRANGTLEKWGNQSRDVITKAPDEANFQKIVALTNYALALRKDGSLISWGNDSNRRVTDTPSDAGYVGIAHGGAGTVFALKADGSIVTWGGTQYSLRADTPTDGGYVSVSAGSQNAAAVKADGSMVIWGNDNYGMLRDAPTSGVSKVALGNDHGVAIMADGSLYGWGRDWNKSLEGVPMDSGWKEISTNRSQYVVVR